MTSKILFRFQSIYSKIYDVMTRLVSLLCCWFLRPRRLLVCRGCACLAWLVTLAFLSSLYGHNSKGAWSPPVQQEHETDRKELWQRNVVQTENDNTSLHKSRSIAPLISDYHEPTTGVLTTPTPGPVLDTHGIRMMPKSPVLVAEGHALQITCVSIQLMHREEARAPYLTFELPPMSAALERKLSVALRPGGAVLKFARVSRNHEGTYRCVATDNTGRQTYNFVTIKVMRKEGLEDEEVEDQVKAYPAISLDSEDWLDQPQAGDDFFDLAKKRGGSHGSEAIGEKLQELKRHFHDHNPNPVNIQQLLERGEAQQVRVSEYCHKHNMSEVALRLPEGNNTRGLYRHLLVNDKAKTLFCFAPKTGCTNLRMIFFLVLGYIPLSQVVESRDGVDQNRLEAAQFRESFMSRNDNQRLYALKHYFKFAMYRNPLERLVSGYRSKVSRYPLIGLKEDTPHFNWLRKAILLQTQPEQYRAFLHHRGKSSVNISFPDFIEYWLRQPTDLKYDEHFSSISSMCQPCRTRYSFYANFKHFDTDSQLLVQKVKARPEFLRAGYYGDSEVNTTELAPTLYAQLSAQQKHAVLHLLADEMDFYYHLFPEEMNCHKKILDLSIDLPV